MAWASTSRTADSTAVLSCASSPASATATDVVTTTTYAAAGLAAVAMTRATSAPTRPFMMSVPAHVDGDGRPARETARRRSAGACVETRPRRPRARRVPARRESSRVRSIPGPEQGDQRPLESSSRVSPFEKTSHGCPRPAAAGGARIGADIEARLAVYAHRHSPKRQGQRPQDRSAVHSVAGSLEEREGESEPVEGGSEQPHGRCVQPSGPFYFKDVTECSGDSFPRSDREPASAPGDLPEDRRAVRSGLPGTGAGAS